MLAVSRVLSAMPTLLRVSIAMMLQYRGEIILWAVWGLVFPAVSIAMWTTAAQGGAMGTFQQGDIAAYFFLTMILGHLTANWDVYDMGWVVRTGELSGRLLRPMLPIWPRIAENLAYKIVTLGFVGPIWLLVVWYVRPTFHTSLCDLLLGVPATLLAMAVAYVWGYVAGTMAFFITKMDAFGELYFGASLFFGGRFAAIEWLPGPLRWISAAMPFRWSMAFPIELLMGRLSAAEVRVGLAWQAAWLVIGVMVMQFLWKQGLKRYAAVGA